MITEPDRSRRHEKDDSVQSGEWSASYHAALRGVRALRSRMLNNWESSGTMREAVAKEPLGRTE